MCGSFGDSSGCNLLPYSNLIRLDIECGQNADSNISCTIDGTAATIPTN